MNSNFPGPDDDEEDVDAAEIDEATERGPARMVPPEVSPKLENLTEWDQPPDATGEAAPKVLPEDEASVEEELVDEGLEEADRDQRIASVDPDFEP